MKVVLDSFLRGGAVWAVDSLQLDNFHLLQEANPAPRMHSSKE